VYLKKRNATEESVETEVQRFKEERRKNMKQEDSEVREVISQLRATQRPNESRADEYDSGDEVRHGGDDDDNDSDSRQLPFASPARGQGRASRRPARGWGESSRRGGRGRGGRGRASSAVSAEPSASSSRGSRTTRPIVDAFSTVPSSKRSNINSSAMYV